MRNHHDLFLKSVSSEWSDDGDSFAHLGHHPLPVGGLVSDNFPAAENEAATDAADLAAASSVAPSPQPVERRILPCVFSPALRMICHLTRKWEIPQRKSSRDFRRHN
jgi:hypothetical protein